MGLSDLKINARRNKLIKADHSKRISQKYRSSAANLVHLKTPGRQSL